MSILRLIFISFLFIQMGCGFLDKKPSANHRMGEAKLIGVIEMVNPEQNYVLINCEQHLQIPPGTQIVAQNPDGTKTKLQVTPERKGNYITADIKEGTPQVKDLVLYQVKPGDIPAQTITAMTTGGAIAPLVPLMQADVIPPLNAPFQSLNPTRPSSIPVPPQLFKPTPVSPPTVPAPAAEPEPDLSKLPPVIR